MKRNITTAAVITAAIVMSTQFGMIAKADGMPYEPVFESVPITESITSTANVETTTQPSTTKITPIKDTPTEAPAGVEANNLQNALMQLDGAQVEIRNQLLQYKSEYSAIDNQYKVIKEQRAAKAKQIRDVEKKIKSLDSTKEKIRKNMN